MDWKNAKLSKRQWTPNAVGMEAAAAGFER
jgi:hypothetical protein